MRTKLAQSISVPLFRGGKAVNRIRFTSGAKGMMVYLGQPLTPGYEIKENNEKYIGMIQPNMLRYLHGFIDQVVYDIMVLEEIDGKQTKS